MTGVWGRTRSKTSHPTLVPRDLLNTRVTSSVLNIPYGQGRRTVCQTSVIAENDGSTQSECVDGFPRFVRRHEDGLVGGRSTFKRGMFERN